MSQPSRVFPVTPDVPPLKGSGIYLLLEPWTMKQAFFFFFCKCLWVPFQIQLPSCCLLVVDLLMSSECGMCLAWLDESWTAVPAPLQHHDTCDRRSQLPWCVQPYSEIHGARGQWPCCCDISGGSSCGPPVLSEDSSLIWYFCYNFIKIPSNKKKLTCCKLWTLTKCEIWKCFCKQVNFFYGKNNLLCTMPQDWYFLNWGQICNFFWNWQMKLTHACCA